MPLHLLGKKSWNVYNPANIERVQRDEAKAKKRDEEAERQRRHDEAEGRIAALREERDYEKHNERAKISSGRDYDEDDQEESSRRRMSKKRKLPGEDDTDREIRLAQAQSHNAVPASRELSSQGKSDHSITDANGNISLIPMKTQVEDSAHKKQKPDQNPSHFYLSEAAAYGSKAGDKPWYSTTTNHAAQADGEAWGASSPRRKEREAARMSANDPLAAMKRGVKQLRESERERKEWKEQRERDLREVEDLAREKSKRDRERHKRRDRGRQEDDDSGNRRHRRRRRSGSKEGGLNDDLESLDGFNLDQGYKESHEEAGHRHRRHHHHHRHRRRRSRSPRKE